MQLAKAPCEAGAAGEASGCVSSPGFAEPGSSQDQCLQAFTRASLPGEEEKGGDGESMRSFAEQVTDSGPQNLKWGSEPCSLPGSVF